jgi:hypothetical protein
MKKQEELNNEILQELADLQKQTEPKAFKAVLDLARECAQIFPTKVPKRHLRLVSRQTCSAFLFSSFSSTFYELLTKFC